jgi:hypothetical protein
VALKITGLLGRKRLVYTVPKLWNESEGQDKTVILKLRKFGKYNKPGKEYSVPKYTAFPNAFFATRILKYQIRLAPEIDLSRASTVLIRPSTVSNQPHFNSCL